MALAARRQVSGCSKIGLEIGGGGAASAGL